MQNHEIDGTSLTEQNLVPVRESLLYVFRHAPVKGSYLVDPGITSVGNGLLREAVQTTDLTQKLIDCDEVGCEVSLFITRTKRAEESMDVIEEELIDIVKMHNLKNITINARSQFYGLYPEDTLEKLWLYEDTNIDLIEEWLKYSDEEAKKLKINSYSKAALAFAALPLTRYFAAKPFPYDPMRPDPARRVPATHQIAVAVSHSGVIAANHKLFSHYPDYAYSQEDVREGSFLRYEMDYANGLMLVSNHRREFYLPTDIIANLYKQYSHEYLEEMRQKRLKTQGN